MKEQALELPTTTLFGASAYAAGALQAQLAAQVTSLRTPQKQPKGQALILAEKYYNRCVSRLQQPIESLFNWFNAKTDLQMPIKGSIRYDE